MIAWLMAWQGVDLLARSITILVTMIDRPLPAPRQRTLSKPRPPAFYVYANMRIKFLCAGIWASSQLVFEFSSREPDFRHVCNRMIGVFRGRNHILTFMLTSVPL